MFKEFIDFVREIYDARKPLLLHVSKFVGNEKKYLNQYAK